MSFLTGFTNRKKLTIQKDKVSGSSPHLNFPVHVHRQDDPDLKIGKVQSLGQDFRFTTDDGVTLLDYELEDFLQTSIKGDLHAWVRIPSLDPTVDTVIYLYYNNPGAVDAQNKNAVWDSNYKLVYHMGEASGGVGAIKDSTSNNNHGTTEGNPAFGINTKLGKGIDFGGLLDKLFSTINMGIIGDGARTISFWADIVDIEDAALVNIGVASNNNLFSVQQSGVNNAVDSFGTVFTAALTNDDLDQHVVTHENGHTEYYINGVRSGIGNEHVYNTIDSILRVAHRPDGYAVFGSTMDEVRISDIARDADWIMTTSNNQNSPSTFFNTGFEEPIRILSIVKCKIIRNTVKNNIIRHNIKVKI